MKFIITSIDSGKILAREKNPYGEEPNISAREVPENDIAFKEWYEAERQLKTYPLSSESAQKFLISNNWELGKSKLKYFRPALIGQEIEGEVVNGEIHIK